MLRTEHFLRELRTSTGRKDESWTLREIEILERHYRTMSASDIQQRFLPHRTLNAIRNTASAIKAGKWLHCEWDEGEIEILRVHYPLEGTGCSKRLPKRTPGAVRAKAYEIGLTTHWPEEDIEILRRTYPDGGSRASAEKLPWRSLSAIRSKVQVLGLRYHRRKGDGTSGQAWTEAELIALKENSHLKLGELCKLLPDRTKVSIKTMRQRLRRGRTPPQAHH
jgi:hypothetical protein